MNSPFLEKRKIPISLRGDKNAITLTMADHDLCAGAFCDLYQLSSLICAVIRNGAVCFKIESCSEIFQRFFAQRRAGRRQFRIPSGRFLNKGGRASADWRSEIQVCSRRRAADFLDAKF